MNGLAWSHHGAQEIYCVADSTMVPRLHEHTGLRTCWPRPPSQRAKADWSSFPPRLGSDLPPPPPFFSSKRPYLESVCPVPSFVDRQISGEPLFQASSTLIPTPRLRPSARPVPPRPPGRPSQVVAGYDQLLLAKIRGRFRRNTNGNSFSPSKQHHHLAQCFPSLSTSLRQCGLPFSVYTFS